MDVENCGVVYTFDDSPYDLECELAPGHDGNHSASFEWFNESYGPRPYREPSWPGRKLQEVYGKMIEHQLSAQAVDDLTKVNTIGEN